MKLKCSFVGVLPVVLGACAAPPVSGGAPAPGWIELFDGRSLAGWTPKITGHALGDDPDQTFRVREGVIAVDYADYEGDFGDRFGHLFHELELSRYRLLVEYRFVGEQHPGGPGWAWRNSGVMLHCQDPESMTVDQHFPVSIEAQFLGGDGVHERSNANLCTPGTHVEIAGESVTRHCIDADSPTAHGDEWVMVEVEVLGRERVTHFVAGEPVLTYGGLQLDPGDADAAALIASGAPRELDHGFIALQAESHGIEFRRVAVLALP